MFAVKRKKLAATLLSTLVVVAFFGVFFSTVFAQGDRQYVPLTNIPGFVNGEPTEGANDLEGLVNALFIVVIGLGALFAVVRIAIAGVEYMTTDVTNKKGSARDAITGSLLGLGILLSTYVVLFTINPNLVKLDLSAIDPVDVADVELNFNRTFLGSNNEGIVSGECLNRNSEGSCVNLTAFVDCDAAPVYVNWIPLFCNTVGPAVCNTIDTGDFSLLYSFTDNSGHAYCVWQAPGGSETMDLREVQAADRQYVIDRFTDGYCGDRGSTVIGDAVTCNTEGVLAEGLTGQISTNPNRFRDINDPEVVALSGVIDSQIEGEPRINSRDEIIRIAIIDNPTGLNASAIEAAYKSDCNEGSGEVIYKSRRGTGGILYCLR